MTIKHIQSIALSKVSNKYDQRLFQGVSWSQTSFYTHHEMADFLKNKHPYTITILIDPLKWELRNKKEYVQKTKTPMISKYRELLYDLFFKEFGESNGNELYRKWLNAYQTVWQKNNAYQSIDDFIIKKELEPRYKHFILTQYKNHEELFKNRIRIDRKRYYRVPEPLNKVDWRNPYDNIFVWEEHDHKVTRRGGSGSSGGRETNSLFILGLLELNKHTPVPSFLFVYTGKNELKFLHKFDRLCVPINDIGSNYPACTNKQINDLKQGELFIQWNPSHRQHIEIIQYV